MSRIQTLPFGRLRSLHSGPADGREIGSLVDERRLMLAPHETAGEPAADRL